jgi:hypothetical protein
MSPRRRGSGEEAKRRAEMRAYVRRHIVFPLAVIGALLGAGVIVLVSALAPDTMPGVSDTVLVATAEESAEARAFLRRYPQATATVDRSGRVAVDFRAGSARLRVFLDSGPRVSGAVLECPDRPPIDTDVVEAARAGCS